MNKGIVLMNLGSPDSTTVKDVRKYLNEFLMDERVIDVPFILRSLLVRGIIVPFRAPKSAHAYQTIWTDEGSPLMVLTKQLQIAVQQKTDIPVEIAMRYGNPSPKVAFDNLVKQNPAVDEVVLFPLYPHYAMSSYETAVEYAKEIHKQNNYSFKLTIVEPYYNNNDYINALVESIKPYINKNYDKIVFSYHGIPERHVRKSDTTKNHCLLVNDCCNVNSAAHKTCYRHQVFETTKLVTQALGINTDKWELTFQSRLDNKWLKPFTDIRLEEMPKQGIKKILILCPAFVSDCLETLEEIAIRGKEVFTEAGGEEYEMIPCLNVNELWVNTVLKLCNNHVH
ncbi:MAG: ferrochelatase [Chitinophaga sp.]|jgi:protoporphyrin/coproporphyrin ferrochelatase|nr:ferrochelatase [Chitinophaga sp.]